MVRRDSKRQLPGARVGTLDKFQGQEAPVSIYSMASSTPADAPRGMEFLYSLNRLSVATSRARCLTVLVASPELIRVRCRTPRQMQLANALCRYSGAGVAMTRRTRAAQYGEGAIAMTQQIGSASTSSGDCRHGGSPRRTAVELRCRAVPSCPATESPRRGAHLARRCLEDHPDARSRSPAVRCR
jgi:hypothetical protein